MTILTQVVTTVRRSFNKTRAVIFPSAADQFSLQTTISIMCGGDERVSPVLTKQ